MLSISYQYEYNTKVDKAVHIKSLTICRIPQQSSTDLGPMRSARQPEKTAPTAALRKRNPVNKAVPDGSVTEFSGVAASDS